MNTDTEERGCSVSSIPRCLTGKRHLPAKHAKHANQREQGQADVPARAFTRRVAAKEVLDQDEARSHRFPSVLSVPSVVRGFEFGSQNLCPSVFICGFLLPGYGSGGTRQTLEADAFVMLVAG